MRHSMIFMLAWALLMPFVREGRGAVATTAPAATKPTGFARWEKNIAEYEAADKANPPPKGAERTSLPCVSRCSC